ncbi:MAG: transposase [Microcella pacifica]
MSRSTWHYRRNPRSAGEDPIPQKDRAYSSRISNADRAEIGERIIAGWAQGHSVDHSFAAAWDEEVMLGSRRTWWRVAAQIEDQSIRPIAPTRRGSSRPPRQAPVLEATGPGQVWSWDITDLRTPWRGASFKAYSIIDIYSRKLVGYRVEDREVDDLAVEMFRDAIAIEGIPEIVHADSGPAMRSSALKDYLGNLGIAQTHNRPRTSNDNPFSESEFRTMKYRPNYPGSFGDDRTSSSVHELVCALVQREPQALRHCPVLTERGPRRQLAADLGATHEDPAGVLRTAPRTIPSSPHRARARRPGRHQPPRWSIHQNRRHTTPRSLTTPEEGGTAGGECPSAPDLARRGARAARRGAARSGALRER